MRNAVSLLKHYPRGTALSRTALAVLILAVGFPEQGSGARGRDVGLARLAGGAAAGQGFGLTLVTRHSPIATRRSPLSSSALPLPGKPDPALAAILLPRLAPPGAYRLAVTGQPIEAARAAVMAALAPAARIDDPRGAWVIRPADPLEAFGGAGIYDRARLARLFAGKPVYLARGAVERDGQVVASITLISPCPDATLSRLSPGTIVILFDVAAAKAR